MTDIEFEPGRILEVLARHGVEYVLVGGLGARAHGATRPTSDIDCVPGDGRDNLSRLAAALRELNARLRVGGMSDEESQRLPVLVDAPTLESFGNSTWMTDAGPIDVLREFRRRDGTEMTFVELRDRGVEQEIGGLRVRVAGLDDIIASKEYADRNKDREALPELRRLRDAR